MALTTEEKEILEEVLEEIAESKEENGENVALLSDIAVLDEKGQKDKIIEYAQKKSEELLGLLGSLEGQTVKVKELKNKYDKYK